MTMKPLLARRAIPHVAQSERFLSGAASAPRFFRRGLTPNGTHFVIHSVSGTALAAGSLLGNTTPFTGG